MISDFFNSIKAYIKAVQLIKTLKLWKYFLIPAVLGFILGVIFILAAYGLSDNIGAYIYKYWKFDFGRNIVEKLSNFIGGLSVIIIGIILFKHLLMALSAPFMTPVSEKVEAYLTQKNKVSSKLTGVQQLLRSLKLNLSNMIKELLITLPLLILSFIPVIGIVFTILIFYYQSYYAGIGNMDYTVERHLNYKQSKLFYKKNKGTAVGNGLVFTGLLFIPFAGIMLALPFATVAATIESIKKLKTFK